MFGWILFIASLFIIVFLLLRKPKEKVIYIQKDIDAELKNRLEQEYLSKAAKMDQELAAQREQKLQELAQFKESKLQDIVAKQSEFEKKRQEDENLFIAELTKKRSNAISELDNEISLRKERNEKIKLDLDEWITKEKNLAELKVAEIQSFINEWKSKQDAVVESFKKLDELNNKESFHKISFDFNETQELIELGAAIKKLRNPMPFYKAVYEIYYKNKINDLVLRVVGANRVSGIYKITHIASGKTYVGQSVDIGNRWKQHAKRGCGADILTANKLYPAMLEYGVENFLFEIVEVIEDTTKLNEAEKYWQDYFKAQEFGYSMK